MRPLVVFKGLETTRVRWNSAAQVIAARRGEAFNCCAYMSYLFLLLLINAESTYICLLHTFVLSSLICIPVFNYNECRYFGVEFASLFMQPDHLNRDESAPSIRDRTTRSPALPAPSAPSTGNARQPEGFIRPRCLRRAVEASLLSSRAVYLQHLESAAAVFATHADLKSACDESSILRAATLTVRSGPSNIDGYDDDIDELGVGINGDDDDEEVADTIELGGLDNNIGSGEHLHFFSSAASNKSAVNDYRKRPRGDDPA